MSDTENGSHHIPGFLTSDDQAATVFYYELMGWMPDSTPLSTLDLDTDTVPASWLAGPTRTRSHTADTHDLVEADTTLVSVSTGWSAWTDDDVDHADSLWQAMLFAS